MVELLTPDMNASTRSRATRVSWRAARMHLPPAPAHPHAP